jgi:hypothetical protein
MSSELNADELATCLSSIAEIEAQSTHSPLAYGLTDPRAIQALCQCYVRASRRQRAEMRHAVRDKLGLQNQLIAYVYRAAEQVRVTSDAMWLRTGAAAAAMQGGQMDQRDFLWALARLYLAAEAAGLDPKPTFEAMGGAIPGDFHTYAVVKNRNLAKVDE